MPKPSRRGTLMAAFTSFGRGSGKLAAAGRGNSYYRGPPSDHFDGTRFFNPVGSSLASSGAPAGRPGSGPRSSPRSGPRGGPRGCLDLLRWTFAEPWAPWPASLPSPFPPDAPPPAVAGDAIRVACIGHASFLIQTRGHNILLDPVWAERASPLSFLGPRRFNPPGVAFDALPRIDCVLITHNHYDHMDTGTIARLWQRFAPRVVTPLGNDAILRAAVPGLAAEAVDWDAYVDLGGGVAVHVEPCLHWSARGAWDRAHALWASFVLETGARKLYCVGDSGFGDGAPFRRVRQRHPALALALLPIGAYEPRWFMRHAHMSPPEAVAALELCGAAQALGHHWGTFRLSNEAAERPAADLAAALAERGIPAERFGALRPGEVRMLG
jgi:L-ascorbate metabolism protein UlaG (beta-lactamase superfamily)